MPRVAAVARAAATRHMAATRSAAGALRPERLLRAFLQLLRRGALALYESSHYERLHTLTSTVERDFARKSRAKNCCDFSRVFRERRESLAAAHGAPRKPRQGLPAPRLRRH